MQREIKFRGQKVDNKHWVVGGYSKHIKDNNRHFITVMSKDHISDIGWHQEVIPETIGQYTGLKDKNGKEIYEGDVISIYRKERDIIEKAFVYWHEKYASFLMFPLCDWEYTSWDEVEVIGNIHDNPELLEVSHG